MKIVYFATNNPYKFEEVQAIAGSFGITTHQYACNVRELQTMDRKQLIRHKTVEAFKQLRHPVLVDHASLEIYAMNGMPGPLTQLFWDNLQARICDVVAALGDPRASAICTVGYCDGRRLYHDEGVMHGSIAARPAGDRHFQWDTIFIPTAHTKTYGEMDIPEKNSISQRKIAFENLFQQIKSV